MAEIRLVWGKGITGENEVQYGVGKNISLP